MKKLAILSFAALLIVSCGCAGLLNETGLGGAGDWSYPLIGQYEIWRLNSRQIELVRRVNENESHPVITDYVLSFQNNDRFIGIKALTDPEWEQNAIVPTYAGSDAVYYLFDTDGKNLNGPYYSEAEYLEKCLEAEAKGMCSWIDTYPDPQGVKIGR